jgi:hypothetical protein
MATPQLQGSFVRIFALSEIARFVKKDLATVRKWFERIPGVRKFPRGYGKQKPSLGIPEPIARVKLIDIGFSAEEISTGLVEPFDQRLEEERTRAESPPPAPLKRTPKSKLKSKAPEPARRAGVQRKRTR